MRVRFIDLPRHRRRSAVIRLKNMLRSSPGASPSKTFWTYDDLERLQQEGEKTSFDLLFLGTDRFTYWRARFFTKPGAEYFIINNMAYEQTMSLLSMEECQQDEVWTEEWFNAVRRGDNWQALPPLHFASLGGLTFDQHVELVLQRIKCEPPLIEPEFWVRTNYVNGIGLFAIVDHNVLTLAVVEETIKKFQTLGEISVLPKGRPQFGNS